MLIVRDAQDGSRELAYVRAALDQGEIVAIPTDTVYGLAALAASEDACWKLYDVKRRDRDQPTAVVFASIDDIAMVLPTLSEPAWTAIEVLLPGPLTLVVRNPTRSMPWACGANPDAIGIRVPDGAVPVPPVIATSANFPGEPEVERLEELPSEITRHIACGIDRGPLATGAPSTVLDLTAWEWGGEVSILRDPRGVAAAAIRALGQLQ